MRIWGLVPRCAEIKLSTKRDMFLLPALFAVNTITFSAWHQLSRVEAMPWLLLVWLYSLAALVPLLWRERAPLTVFVTQWVLTMGAWSSYPHYVPVVGVPVALHAVSAHYRTKIAIPAVLLSLVPAGLGAAVAFRSHSGDPDLALRSFISDFILLFLVSVAAAGAGRVTRTGRQHVERLERERKTAQGAVTVERRRIARELHDIVSHAVTVIVLQAAGASRVAETDFAKVMQALGHIESTGKQAMTELRRLLGVLDTAESEGEVGLGFGELVPQPGLASLPALLSSLRDTGLPVTVHIEGAPRELDQSVDLAAYRIVQEGLTNILKHPGKDTNPRLRLVWEARSLLIQIDNDINRGSAARHGQVLSAGRGLVGLRERAHAAGGRLQAGPHDGGYRLTATLPARAPSNRNPASVTGDTTPVESGPVIEAAGVGGTTGEAAE